METLPNCAYAMELRTNSLLLVSWTLSGCLNDGDNIAVTLLQGAYQGMDTDDIEC